VYVNRDSTSLFIQAQILLWPYWVAIGVSTWTNEHGRWPLKLAPFFIPPFRVLVLNRWGGFFPGRPIPILLHLYRFWLASAISGWTRLKEVGDGVRRCGPVRRVCDVTSGFTLFALAATLKWLSYPYRGWFQTIHGDAPLDADVDVSGSGVDRFVQNEPFWDADRFTRFVRSSDARWICWQKIVRGSVPHATDVISPLLADPLTFAVSKQSKARGWKPALLPMAPFRHLQANTATQVLAPLAPTILVDRAKLAALGIPRTKLTETAWMQLFWRAAAAGWRCYSEPAAEQTGLQPDFPVQETEFFFRFLADRELRHLGPRKPDLSRGNIRLAPTLQLPLRPGFLKVLVLSPFLPYPLAHGGAVRIFSLCRELTDTVDFILIAVREAHEVAPYEQLHQIFRHVYVVDIDERESSDDRLPTQVRAVQSASLRALIADVCERFKPDLLQIEFTHMASYRDCAPTVPAVLVEHDLTFKLYGQLWRTNPSDAKWSEYNRWLDFERHWLPVYDAVWTMSLEDRVVAIQEGSAREGTFVVPNGVDIQRFVPGKEECESEAFPVVLYVGSFRHLPNILGFQKLCREVMPRVLQRVPDVRLRVVAGPRHEYFWRTLSEREQPIDSDPRIEVRGYVEDLRPLYTQATVVVAPLEVSAGTNIKVLEAMACAKTVVVTPIGCAGLELKNGEDAFICEDWEKFAEAVCAALLNAPLRSRVGARARQTIEAHYSWASVARSAYLSYRTLVGRGSD
jgi:glycosyltransferase involved in cell wall biosynthesis